MNWISRSMQARLMTIIGAGLGVLLITAFISINLLNRQLDQYREFIEQNLAQERTVNRMNFDFKIQVQEWKNVLLRGSDTEQRQKYWRQFQEQHQVVQQEGRELLASLEQGPTNTLVEAFLKAHREMLASYKTGYQAFEASGFDPTAGDRAVKGIDREPSRLLEEAADQLSTQVAELAKAVDAASAQVSFWAQIAIGIVALLVLALVWWTLRVSFLQPLRQIMAQLRQMAAGDYSNRLDLERSDELGQLSADVTNMQGEVAGLINSIKDSAIHLGNASDNINRNAEEISGFTGETEGSTDQVATAVNEMSSTVQEVAQNASGAANAAQEADMSARHGRQVVQETIDSISSLSSEVGQVSEAMQRLESETNRIGSVLVVIKGVAEQTNLLALNAAIEAARAGEQGRGFAVVADEVRTLAKRTTDSTAEIQEIIEAVQKGAGEAMRAMASSIAQTDTTVTRASEAGDAITAITRAVENISDMNTHIATAAEEQSYAADEINKNITRVVELVQRAHESAVRSTGTAKTMDELARGLRSKIEGYRV